MDGSSDTGTVLKNGDMAIVVHDDGTLSLYIPNSKGEEGYRFTLREQALAACFVRLDRDESFIKEMAAWFKDMPTS